MENFEYTTDGASGLYRCYHGTGADFDISQFRPPAYFSSSPETAAFFCRNEADPKVVDAVLLPTSWIELDFHGDSWGGSSLWWDRELFEQVADYGSAGSDAERAYWEESGVTTDLVADYLNDRFGYDLVVFHNVVEEDGSFSSIYVAFEGCQAYETRRYSELMR